MARAGGENGESMSKKKSYNHKARGSHSVDSGGCNSWTMSRPIFINWGSETEGIWLNEKIAESASSLALNLDVHLQKPFEWLAMKCSGRIPQEISKLICGICKFVSRYSWKSIENDIKVMSVYLTIKMWSITSTFLPGHTTKRVLHRNSLHMIWGEKGSSCGQVGIGIFIMTMYLHIFLQLTQDILTNHYITRVV